MKKTSVILGFVQLLAFSSLGNAQECSSKLLAGTTLESAKVSPGAFSISRPLSFGPQTFDLTQVVSLVQFSNVLQNTIRFVAEKHDPQQPAPAYLPQFANPFVMKDLDISSKALLASLNEVAALTTYAQACDNNADAIVHIHEIVHSLNLLVRKPQPDLKLRDLGKTVHTMLFNRYVTVDSKRANNLSAKSADDLSLVDPIESTYWKRPADLAKADTYIGMQRSQMLSTNGNICTYVKPKTSYGTHAGFTINCGGGDLKIKFGDEHVEPFQARIFSALGFNVDPVDYVHETMVSYDRRILTEINERKIVEAKLALPSILPDFKIFTVTLQLNAFSFIKAAVLKDGTVVLKKDLPNFLLNRKMADWDKVHLNDIDFNEKAEAKISHLLMEPAQLQAKNASITTVGPWDWDALEHEKRRETRGLLALTAWIGNYDVRYDNTRLFMKTENGRKELLHLVSDLGSGLGNSKNGTKIANLDPNNFQWKNTKVHTSKYGRKEIEFTDYLTLNANLSYENANIDDIRWMVRLIAQLTEKQITDALIASGISSEFVRATAERLISRRDGMVKDLDLVNTYGLLRKTSQENFNYNPKKDGLVRTTAPDGSVVVAPDGGNYVKNGMLVLPYKIPGHE